MLRLLELELKVEKKGDESVGPRKHVTIMHGNLRLRLSLGYQLGGGREKFRGGRKARTTKTSEVVEITPTCIC
jgi:hypothetical protein